MDFIQAFDLTKANTLIFLSDVEVGNIFTGKFKELPFMDKSFLLVGLSL